MDPLPMLHTISSLTTLFLILVNTLYLKQYLKHTYFRTGR